MTAISPLDAESEITDMGMLPFPGDTPARQLRCVEMQGAALQSLQAVCFQKLGCLGRPLAEKMKLINETAFADQETSPWAKFYLAIDSIMPLVDADRHRREMAARVLPSSELAGTSLYRDAVLAESPAEPPYPYSDRNDTQIAFLHLQPVEV